MTELHAHDAISKADSSIIRGSAIVNGVAGEAIQDEDPSTVAVDGPGEQRRLGLRNLWSKIRFPAAGTAREKR